VVTDRQGITDDEVDDLLGAYALDACDPNEATEIEGMLARRPALAEEAARLSHVAAWIGAIKALEPPPRLREQVLAAARRRRSGPADPVIDLYVSLEERFGQAIEEFPPTLLAATTANGLAARDLAVHMAAQESLLAQNLGIATAPDIVEDDIDARTYAMIPRFADLDLDDVLELWRDSVEANRAWAVEHPNDPAPWRGMPLSRDDTLTVRAFEAWIHADDLRRVVGVEPTRPAARHLAVMSDLAARILPLTLAVTGRSQPGKTARLVLTGDGGGDWTVPMGEHQPQSAPDVTIVADVVDWCLLVGDRIAPSELRYTAEGDTDLVADVLAAVPALATL